MYERIMRTGKIVTLNPNSVNEQDVELYNIYSADMRTVLETLPGISSAISYLEEQLRMERLACANGSCED